MNDSGYVYLTRRERFCASHRLHSPHLSLEENRKLYQKCNYDNGHGHNYELFVTIRGIPDPQTGIVIFLDELKDIIHRVIINRVDHRHLNMDIPELSDVIPTAENLVVAFWNWLKPELPEGMLYEVKLCETENNTSVYRG